MKIKTYQTGGIVYLPTSSRKQEVAAQQSAASSSKSSDFTKNIFDLIKTKGLDSDIGELMKRIQTTLDVAGDPNGDTLTTRDFISILPLATSATTNYERYTQAVNHLESANA